VAPEPAVRRYRYLVAAFDYLPGARAVTIPERPRGKLSPITVPTTWGETMTAKTSDIPVTRQRRAGARRAVDVAYGYLAAFFVVGVLIQVYLAGIGIFGINSTKVAHATSLDPHRTWGTVLMVLSLILLILALIAWASRTTVIWTFVLALLVIVAQTALAAAGENSKWIGGLHALDGMVILLLSLWLAITARRRRTASGNAR
jgi:Family of unknown function (DUF6220)